MDEDERCCGSGTCMINAEGLCWCGQQWSGTTMCRPATPEGAAPATSDIGLTPREEAADEHLNK